MSAFRQGVMFAVFAVVILLIFRLATVSNGRLEFAERQRIEVEGTCHSLKRFFVGGVTRISALFTVEVVTDHEDWPDVVRLMEDLAE
jgi:multisubunit Na+/H+ antiporter MnhB subunit